MPDFAPSIRSALGGASFKTARSCMRTVPAVAAAAPLARFILSRLVLAGMYFFVLAGSVAASTRDMELAELTDQWEIVAIECKEPIYPASVTSSDLVGQIKAERAAYRACLDTEIKKVKRRTSAKRMTDAALWRKLGPRERGALDKRLKRANKHVIRDIDYGFQRHSARADVIIHDYYDQGYPIKSVKDKAMRDARRKAEAARAAQAMQRNTQSGGAAPAGGN